MVWAVARATPLLRLARLTVAYGVMGNLWFVILWTRALHARGEPAIPNDAPVLSAPLWLLLGASALVAGGLVSFAAALNDSLDLERDRTINPLRPMAAGEVDERTASVVIALSLLAGILGALAFGAGGVAVAIVVALAILALITFARFVPALGLPLVAFAHAAHMFIPEPGIAFVAPVALVLTHSLTAAGLAHIVGGKAPRISRRAVLLIALTWGVMIAALLALGRTRLGGDSAWPEGMASHIALAPLIAAALFVIVATRKVRQVGRGPRAAEKVARYAALWLPIYGAAWLAGIGAWGSAIGLAAYTLFGFVGASTAREVFGLIERPVAYRR